MAWLAFASAWLVACRGEAPSPPDVTTTEALAPDPCGAGVVVDPSGRWRVRFAFSRTRPAGGAAGSETQLEAVLSAQARAGAVRVQVDDVITWRSRAGAIVVPEATGREALRGTSATARFGPDGRLAGLEMPMRAAPGALEVLGAVLVELDGLVPAFGTAAGAGLFGRFDGSWRCEAGLWRRARRWEGAAPERAVGGPAGERVTATLASDATLALQPGRMAVGRWQLSEAVSLADAEGRPDGEARWTLSLEALDGAAAPVQAREGVTDARGFTVPAANVRVALAEAAPLLERAGGLTGEALLASVRATAGASEVPADPDLLWQGSGLLMLRPDLAEALAAVPDARATPAGLGRLLSLLVSCGRPHCQQAAVRVLSDPRHASRPQAGHHLQQLALLARPTLETGAFLLRAFEGASRGDVAWGAANALAIALRHHRDDPASAPWRAALRRVHDRSDTPEDRAKALTLLGTSHDPAFAEPIAAAMDAPHQRLRIAATRAASRMPGARFDDLLLAATRDAVPDVRRRALEAFADREAPAATWAAIAERWATRTDHDDLEVTWLLAAAAEAVPPAADGSGGRRGSVPPEVVGRLLKASARSTRLSDPVRGRLRVWLEDQATP